MLPTTTETGRDSSVLSNNLGLTSWITAQRPARKTSLGLDKPHGVFLEDERMESGKVVRSGAILLINRECPWRCLMCDLWINTTTTTVPAGAIPRQIDFALRT